MNSIYYPSWTKRLNAGAKDPDAQTKQPSPNEEMNIYYGQCPETLNHNSPFFFNLKEHPENEPD